MYYFLNAHKSGKQDRQAQFYQEEKNERHAWEDALVDKGWTVTTRLMNREWTEEDD